MSDKLTRIAIVSADKCKPKKCRQECKRSCPVNRMGNFVLKSSLLPRLPSSLKNFVLVVVFA
ncbi:Fer4-like domain in RNase L inhibitor, RLI-domain-containing protein [Pilaira anomala]|nr:Fer4-like domain in RNase L inhibitor, RLI-domain-containing protein [Pilaira anomala]